jgi:hypothetical protein
MPDLSITAANVRWVGGTPPKRVKAGATITRGMAVYRDAADGEYKKADANGSATQSVVEGVALTDGFDGGEMLIALDKAKINIGATTTAGAAYGLTSSDAGTANGAAGGICLLSALGSGDYKRPMFVGSGTGEITLAIDNNGAITA